MAKRLIAIMLLLLVVFTACGCGEKQNEEYPEPTEAFFANDFAEEMTDTDIKTICTQGTVLLEKTSAQAVVVTVENTEDKSVYEYADNLRKEWDVGKDQKGGIVVLLCEDDEEVAISVSDSLSNILSENKIQGIIDTYALPHIASGDYSVAVTNVYNSVANEIYIAHGIETDENYVPVVVLPQSKQETKEDNGNVLLSWLILIAIIIAYIFLFGRRGMFIFGEPKFLRKFDFHSFGRKP